MVSSEAAMLRSFGNDVTGYFRSNKEMQALGLGGRISFYGRDIYASRRVYQELRAQINRDKPDVAHVHNSFFMAGPAAYEACFDAGVPVVQTLHNYRFFCAAGTFFRHGKVCEECLSRGQQAGILHGCWHGLLPSWLMTRVIREYHKRGILKKIRRFIALNSFAHDKFVSNGWDRERMAIKPNFLQTDPGCGGAERKHVLFIGALQAYKGVDVLLKAWGSGRWTVPLKIVGSGPLEQTWRSQAPANVEWLGQHSLEDVLGLIKQAVCVVVPSVWYENLPRVIVEAFACGTPVIASRLGALPELVEDGKTGLLFSPGDHKDLAGKIQHLIDDPSASRQMGLNARGVFEERYTADVNHRLLQQIYREAGHAL